MKFMLAMIAVKDIEVSKKFYMDLFDQTVDLDLGWNVTMSGGFALQQNFGWLTGLPEDSILNKSNNMELYFEVDDFDEFLEKLKNYNNVNYVHEAKTHDWKQRVVRIYDPDYHIIEVGEAMNAIAKRYLKNGYSIEEAAKEIQFPVEVVSKWAEEMSSN
ncbi:MAG TPA: glyoxalase/bleomycin resistance/dioxygenase family protein [Oscillospiraceae bacterium]|nr:glyoxalase/bleomycin resistance/dioxygenase family protein [Oscillospiraceae bacterium]